MIRLGHISNGHFQSGGHLLYFPQFDIIKEDVADDANINVSYNRYGSSSIYQNSKAKIKIDFDFVTETELTSLRSVCLNSRRQLIFMKHPSDTAQILDFYGVTSPSSTHKILAIESDSANLAYGGTELSTASYNLVNDYPNNESEYYFSQNAKKYSYIYFNFNIGSYTSYMWQRMTLGLYNPYCLDGSTYSGFQLEVYNTIEGTWTPISKMNFTQPRYISETGYNDNRFIHYASLKSNRGFTRNADYFGMFDSNIKFRMRNLHERVGTLQLGFGYPHLLIDGFAVSIDSDSFNFRSTFTGAGYSGGLEMIEV